MRIAELEVRYRLVEPGEPVYFACSDDSEIVARFVPTNLPGVRLERDNETVVALLARAASGAKYEAPSGVVFWTQGDEAIVEWPEGNSIRCSVMPR